MRASFLTPIGDNLAPDFSEILRSRNRDAAAQFEQSLSDGEQDRLPFLRDQGNRVAFLQAQLAADIARDRDLASAADFYRNHVRISLRIP
jgi:hypothetical protein